MSAGLVRPQASFLLPIAAVSLVCACPVRAQVAAAITLTSDERFRGHSITSGDPVLAVDLTYDDASGVYFGASATAAMVESSPQLVNFRENLGFAHRVATDETIDLGVVRSDYTEYYSGGRKAHFTEFYAGLRTRHFAAYLRYSPDYLWPGVETLYGEVEFATEPAPAWRLSAHFGVLAQIAGATPLPGRRTNYDWKIGLVRQEGPFDLGLDLSGGGPGPDYYQDRRHHRTAITASLRWNL